MSDARSAPEQIAGILIEALPYIRRFSGARIVIKFGGNALAGSDDPDAALASFAQDIVLLHAVGLRPVVVHGGGPQIAELLERLGKTSEFHEGLRVTDAETLEIARMVLVGKVNSEIVAAINLHGALAVGLSGMDANLIRADLLDERLGYVGEISTVDPTIIERLLDQQLIPVIATVGSDTLGQAYNINADTVAGAIAAALGADKLVMLSDVDGIRADVADPTSTIARLDAATLEALIEDGTAAGGMAPKARACIEALRGGVGAAHMLDGRVPHALLLELFTDGGVGTMVEP